MAFEPEVPENARFVLKLLMKKYHKDLVSKYKFFASSGRNFYSFNKTGNEVFVTEFNKK